MKFSIVKNYKIFFAITITFLIIGFGSMLMKGFNLGIDFTGGSIMDLSFDKPVQVAQVRDVLKGHDLGNSIIQLESDDGRNSKLKLKAQSDIGYHQDPGQHDGQHRLLNQLAAHSRANVFHALDSEITQLAL